MINIKCTLFFAQGESNYPNYAKYYTQFRLIMPFYEVFPKDTRLYGICQKNVPLISGKPHLAFFTYPTIRFQWVHLHITSSRRAIIQMNAWAFFAGFKNLEFLLLAVFACNFEKRCFLKIGVFSKLLHFRRRFLFSVFFCVVCLFFQ